MNIGFWLPFEIDMEKSAEDADKERRIRGYASTPSLDRQNEEIIQKGLDISDFVNHGWFNYNHDNTKIIGYPNRQNTKIDNKGFCVDGTILKGVPLADQVWELAKALQKSNAPRKLGFSVEGRILSKDNGGRILKAKVFNVAITPNPINPDATWEILAKSFVGGSEEFIKAMEAGYESKIGDTNNGGVLKAESLESAFSILSHAIGDNDKAKNHLAQLREALVSKSLNEFETLLYLQLYKGLSRTQAETIVLKAKNN